jgi:hypothetical protein
MKGFVEEKEKKVHIMEWWCTIIIIISWESNMENNSIVFMLVKGKKGKSVNVRWSGQKCDSNEKWQVL